MKKNAMYNVRPRYTCGSPGRVSEDIARSVAEEEKIAFQRHLSGIYGTEKSAKAQKEGLIGIVDVYTEMKGHWVVTDLITGDVYRKYFNEPVTKKQMKHLQQNVSDGWRIKKAWHDDNYVFIEYANGVQDKLYQAKLDWIKEMEPTAEIVW